MSSDLVVDLFAGPGGWDVAAFKLGLTLIGIEKDAAACRTRAAAGHLTIQADVATYPAERFKGKAKGLIASPPCPDFSAAGRRKGIQGESGHLIFEVPRWVEIVRPEWVACEQVPEALPYWRDFARAFRGLGYFTWAGELCAADYGVPQERYRAILMASTRGPVEPMLATHAEFPHPSLLTGDSALPWVSMAEGLGWGMTGRPYVTVTTGGTSTGGADPALVGGSGARRTIERERERERERVVGYRRTRGSGMNERHGDRPDTPGDRPAPTITSTARTDRLIVTHTHTHTYPPGSPRPTTGRSDPWIGPHQPSPSDTTPQPGSGS